MTQLQSKLLGFVKSNTILTSRFFFPITFKGLNSELNFCNRYPRKEGIPKPQKGFAVLI